ncbi:MAG: SPOR domain-containing protein [Saprospiraceae bacterium]|nr:SPOR domain-containing protein [Lewinella sp.]
MRSLLFWAFVLIAALYSENVKAQAIQYKENRTITDMMDRWAELNKSKNTVEGWRIQILATNDRQKLESARQTFQYRYPNVPVDWVHNRPWYQLRAGAFSTKLEALRLKYILSQDYTGIYPVKDDNIRPAEIINAAY